MAHFAQIDENSIVINIVVIPNEQEARGQEYLHEIGMIGTWIQTSYNTFAGEHIYGDTPLRGNYATIGGVYDPELDVFYKKKPKEYMVLNPTTFVWEYPVPIPEIPEGKYPKWNESTMDWELLDINTIFV